MKPHSAIMKLPLKIPVSICCTVVLKGAGCTLLKLGELECHLSYRIISFAVIYRNMFNHTKHAVLNTPWQGIPSVTVGYISSCFRSQRWLPLQSAERLGHPQRGIHLVWRRGLNLLQEAFIPLWT